MLSSQFMAVIRLQRGGDERNRRARLTAADRRRIAAGLARGLGPAAIARSLGRPTSTVSREVARGGGPDAYHAGDAQRAAARRARRTPVRGGEPKGPRSRTAGTVAGEVEAEFAHAAEETGLPRSSARVLACLHLGATGDRTARELADHLGLSAASVSVAVGHLHGQGLITRRRVGRREHYTVDGHVWARTWEASLRSNNRWAAVCRRGADLLGPATPAGARLEAAWRFFARLQTDLLLAGRAAGFTRR